jgi:hypothetical protein
MSQKIQSIWHVTYLTSLDISNVSMIGDPYVSQTPLAKDSVSNFPKPSLMHIILCHKSDN